MTNLFINGPVGQLEASFEEAPTPSGCAAVLCHPHPQFGGTMNDHVLAALESSLLAAGVNCLRFNFRGAGESAGSFDHGTGEIDDCVAASAWLREQPGHDRVILVGYSFGGAIALSSQETVQSDCMMLVAPAVGLFGEQTPPVVPTFVILADNDQFVDAAATGEWFHGENTRLDVIPGTDHFFAGHHDRITELATEFLASVL